MSKVPNLNCSHAIGVAEHVRGTNPCDGTIHSLSEAIQVADCCRQRSRFDLATELLDCVDAFPLSKSDPIASRVDRQRQLNDDGDVSPSPESSRIDPETELPPLLIRGWNFATAMARWASGGFETRTTDQIDANLAVCQECEFLKDEHCVQCGCPCVESNRMFNKLALATETCPLGKWK